MALTLPHPVEKAANDRAVTKLAIGLLFGATLLAYLPALSADFIWNDTDYVTAPGLRSVAGLAQIWGKLGATEQYYPLLHSFFWLQHRLWGDHPFGYHAMALLLHAGAAVLFALNLRKLAIPGAWLAALIFALHPVHVESVAWIAEQKNTLSLVFYLGAALAYLHFDETRKSRTYFAALGLFVLSLLGKTVTASLPAALLVVLWWKRGRLEWRRDVRPLLPWLILGLAAGLFSSWVERHYLGAQGGDFTLPFLARGLVAGRAIFFYLENLIWPIRLNFIYPRWLPDAAIWWQWLFPVGAVGLAFALWTLRRRTRAPLAAFLFFAGSLFPVLGFVNLYGALYSFVWDHWQYLPDLGPIALAAAGLTLGWGRVTGPWRKAGPVLVGALAVVLGAMTWHQCGMYRDSMTLYRTILAGNPDSWFACCNLGNILLAEDKPTEAAALYERALHLRSDYPEAQYDLGLALAALKRPDEAITHFNEALRLQPNYAAAHNGLANTLRAQGRSADAIAHYREALRLNPSYADAACNLGLALQAAGQPREAAASFEQALKIRPDFAKALGGLGETLHLLGRNPEAIARFEQALHLQPDSTALHINLGIALFQSGHMQEGLTHLEKAVQLSPDFSIAHRNLAAALRQLRREPEAVSHENTATRLEAGASATNLPQR